MVDEEETKIGSKKKVSRGRRLTERKREREDEPSLRQYHPLLNTRNTRRLRPDIDHTSGGDVLVASTAA
jgi:hypothetical protein